MTMCSGWLMNFFDRKMGIDDVSVFVVQMDSILYG